MSRQAQLGPEPKPDDLTAGAPLSMPFAETGEREQDPGSIAVSVAWDRLRREEQALVPEFARESVEQRQERLAADARAVEFLHAEGFAGERFKKFSGRLVEYGYPVLLHWTNSGEIFEQCAHAGRPVSRHAATFDWTADDRHRLALDTVLDGVEFFRTYALERGGWDPQRGASLTTYFIGACVRCFPPVYNRWWREQVLEQGVLHLVLGTDANDAAVLELPDQRAVDPCQAAVVNDQVHRAISSMDPVLRQGMGLRAIGYSQRDAATALGLTEKALERRAGRHRSKFKEQENRQPDFDDLGGEGDRHEQP